MHREIKTLSELSLDGKGTYGIAASAVPYSNDLYTYLRITDINDNGNLNKDSLKSVDDKKADNYVLKKNDIVFARTGASTGRNYFYDELDGTLVYAGFLIKFTLDPQKINPKFVKYYCQSKYYKEWVYSFNAGSTRGNINAKTFGTLPIPVFSREYQNKVVSILDSIDLKMKNNMEINNNLLVQESLDVARKFCRDKLEVIACLLFQLKSLFAFKSSWWTRSGIKVIK